MGVEEVAMRLAGMIDEAFEEGFNLGVMQGLSDAGYSYNEDDGEWDKL